MNMRTKSSGFTLIELVVVITILGILAAFAVPRFINLETQARAASVQALEGSVRSAAALARGMAMASGNPATISMEGQTITLVHGYPNADSIDNTLADTTGFTYAVASGVGTFTRAGANTGTTCVVTYTPPSAAGQPPTIASNVAGC